MLTLLYIIISPSLSQVDYQLLLLIIKNINLIIKKIQSFFSKIDYSWLQLKLQNIKFIILKLSIFFK